MMNDGGKSDRSIVPEKLPNNADTHAAEAVEGRDRAKGNSPQARQTLDSEPGRFVQCAGACRSGSTKG